MTDWLTPIIVALLTGISVEIIRGIYNYYNKKTDKQIAQEKNELDDNQKLRTELWAEINKLRDDVEKINHELDNWKEKYFKLLGQYTALQASFDDLRREYDLVIIQLETLKKKVNETNA